MFLPILDYIHIPSDEDKAAAILSHLVEDRPEIASKTERVHTETGSARAVLESLVEDGTFGRISDEEARCYDEEISRHEAEERERAEAGACGFA